MSQKQILILSFENDFHALAIQALLRRQGAEADIVDTSRFPETLLISHHIGDEESVLLNGMPLSAYHAIWWRRAAPPAVSDEVTIAEEQRFAARESREALLGMLHAAGLPIYNSPEAEQAACYKPYQMHVARTCCLNIPPTLVTNSSDEVRAFYAEHQHVVYKVFSGTTLMMTDTRPLSEQDLNDLWRLKFAPVIFQKYIPLGREYRVTLIEDDAFTVEIKIDNPKAHYDWRLDQAYEARATTLPDEVIQRLQSLRRALGLHSGSADLRESPDGTIYFLEINPSGQFLFLDAFAGTKAGERFCQMLLQ